MVLRSLIITLSSELRFWWSCILWKAYEIFYKNIQESTSFDQVLSVRISGYRQIIRSLTEISFMVLRILIITLSSELRFRWSYTLWKAYEILYKNVQESISLDQVLSIGISGDRRIIRSLHRNQLHHVLIRTFCSELRFWWSWTL